jgi:hypothetical protein
MMHHVHHALKASGSAMRDNHNVTPLYDVFMFETPSAMG